MVVVGTSPLGPASRAELRAGDTIVAVADHAVSDLADFYTRLWAQGAPGATIPLRIQREADVFEVEVRSADRAALLKKPRFKLSPVRAGRRSAPVRPAAAAAQRASAPPAVDCQAASLSTTTLGR